MIIRMQVGAFGGYIFLFKFLSYYLSFFNINKFYFKIFIFLFIDDNDLV
jgi:hypothetical protein